MDITSSVKKYKNSVTRKYISLSNDEIDVVTKGDYWFSRKYDGQLWFYCKSNKNSKIVYQTKIRRISYTSLLFKFVG